MTVAETARQRNYRLYGRRRVPRSHRRIMLALLAAPGLPAYPLSRLATVGSGKVFIVLWRMEDRGWVSRERHEGYATPLRFAYALTPEGRAAVTALLGLPGEAASG